MRGSPVTFGRARLLPHWQVFVLMPGISGDAVADRLRRLYPELPIVLMTGDAGIPFVATADAPVIRKPFRHGELVDTIRGLLDP